MVRKLVSIFTVSLTFLFIVGCAGTPIRRGGEAARNRTNLAKLNLEMTEDEVVNLMGMPSETEAYKIQGMNLEFGTIVLNMIGCLEHWKTQPLSLKAAY